MKKPAFLQNFHPWQRLWGFGKTLGRIFIYFLFIFYVLFGASMTVKLVQMTENKAQRIQVLSPLIDRSVQNNRLNEVTEWVHLRPLSETDALIKLITPHSGLLEPSLFLELSGRKLQQGQTEEALFWLQLGRYRLRFDMLRCGSPASLKALTQITDLFSSPTIDDLLAKNPELVKKSVQRVLDFDAKYPARNSPDFICATAKKITGTSAEIVSPDQWSSIRFSLRAATEAFLKDPHRQ